MQTAAELRAEAARKRRSADVARRAGPYLTLAADQESMRRLAQELEDEAGEAEAQADAIDAGPPVAS